MKKIIVKFFLKFYKFLTLKGIANFNREQPDINRWKLFLERLPKSDNDVYLQSYNKYRCRMFYFGFFYKIIINAVSIFSILYFHIKNFIIKDLSIRNIDENDFNNKKMIILKDDVPFQDVMPEELFFEFTEYKIFDKKKLEMKMYDKEFRKVFKTVRKKHFFSFHYRYLILRELGLHSAVIFKESPDATIVYVNERNVASPLLRYLYEIKNRELISFMHGEDLFHLIKCFMSFSRYYIWDEQYSNMYINDMYCNIEKYITYKPKKLKKEFMKKDVYSKDLTYYLSGESDDSLRKIHEIVKILQDHNLKMVIRPHPRMSNMKLINDLFDAENVEDLDVTIEDSISDSKLIVGISTTVLAEAYYGGKDILIDDVTNVSFYNNLYDRKYLMLNKDIPLFSMYLNKLNILL